MSEFLITLLILEFPDKSSSMNSELNAICVEQWNNKEANKFLCNIIRWHLKDLEKKLKFSWEKIKFIIIIIIDRIYLNFWKMISAGTRAITESAYEPIVTYILFSIIGFAEHGV